MLFIKFEYTTSMLNNKINEAKKILPKSIFQYLESLVSTYKIRLDTPSWDIVCFLVYNKIYQDISTCQKWSNFWKQTSSEHYFEFNSYKKPVSYNFFLGDKISVKHFEMLIEKIYNNPSLGSWENYLISFFNYCSNLNIKMTDKEFELFKIIIKEQSFSAHKIQNHINMQVSNISKYKKQLKQKTILFQGISLNYPKLNLGRKSILISTRQSNKTDFKDYFSVSPFFDGIYYGDVGIKNCLINFTLPNHFRAEEDLVKAVQKIKEETSLLFSGVFSFERESRIKTINYSDYDNNKRKWKTNLIDLYSSLINDRNAKHTEKYEQFVITEFTDCNSINLKLNKTGLSILNHMKMHNLCSKIKIQRDLQLSTKEVEKQLTYLKKEQLFKERIQPIPFFGLSNIVMFLKEEKEHHRALHLRFSMFPEVYSEPYRFFSKECGILFIIRVQNENIIKIVRILCRHFNKKIEHIFIVDRMYSRRWPLSIHKYDTIFKEWDYSSNDLCNFSE